MTIVDCFIFYNELKMLKFRLKYLYDTVDYFVLVEATRTHSGNPKPLYFQENKEEFKEFLDKIVHVVVDDMPMNQPKQTKLSFLTKAKQEPHWNDINWKRENHQRNCIDRGIQRLNLQPNDIILINDCDEIPNKHTIKSSNIGDGVYVLLQKCYYYNLHTLHKKDWVFSKILNYRTYTSLTPQTIRIGTPNTGYIQNGGWHFSYFGDVKFIQNKLQNFAHQEYNKHEFTSEESIQSRVNSNSDLFGRSNDQFIHTEIIASELPEGYEMLL